MLTRDLLDSSKLAPTQEIWGDEKEGRRELIGVSGPDKGSMMILETSWTA